MIIVMRNGFFLCLDFRFSGLFCAFCSMLLFERLHLPDDDLALRHQKLWYGIKGMLSECSPECRSQAI